MQRVILWLVLILGLGSWIYNIGAISRVSFLTIKNVNVQGVGSAMVAKIQTATLKALDGAYGHYISKDNILFYPRNAIAAAIYSVDPQADSVHISRDGFQGLSITVEEKKPAALACTNLPDFNGDDINMSSDDSCYFVDAKGMLYDQAPTFSGNVYNRYYVPDIMDTASSSDDATGLYATSTLQFTALQNLYSSLGDAGITIDALLIKPGGEYEVYARNPDKSTVVIYLNDLRPIQEQLSNLVSFWDKMTDDARIKNQTLKFDYVDVRYGSNVFYRTI